MTTLQNKIDFVGLIDVNHANPNGDPLSGNRPRITSDFLGEISDVCLKRKIRNRWLDLDQNILVQSDDYKKDDFKSIKDRVAGQEALKDFEKKLDEDEFYKLACATWLDVRSFGQVFAFGKSSDNSKGVSIAVRGPVTIQSAFSVDPVELETLQITKSVNNETNVKGGKSSDTMGLKHRVKYGLYVLKGSINVQLAELTGFSVEDADMLKKALSQLFANDASSARPEGSMDLKRLYWFEHNCKLGQYSPAQVHNSVVISHKEGVEVPTCFEDYDISLKPLAGLEPEIIEQYC
jgi:CRISPR-associated protein Csd2